MIVNESSLMISFAIGLIIGGLIVKQLCDSMVQEYYRENLILELENFALKDANKRLKSSIEINSYEKNDEGLILDDGKK